MKNFILGFLTGIITMYIAMTALGMYLTELEATISPAFPA